ncbi:hypothetical protein, partial [Azorhizophilus paspali]
WGWFSQIGLAVILRRPRLDAGLHGVVFAKAGMPAFHGVFCRIGNLRLGDTFCGLPPIGVDAGFSGFKSRTAPDWPAIIPLIPDIRIGAACSFL